MDGSSLDIFIALLVLLYIIICTVICSGINSKKAIVGVKKDLSAIIASITFNCTSDMKSAFVYWVGVKTSHDNTIHLPVAHSFNCAYKRHGFSTLLFIILIKSCMVNNTEGFSIYLQYRKDKPGNIYFLLPCMD